MNGPMGENNMHTIKFLKKYGTVQEGLSALKSELGIIVKEYPDDGLYVLNYDQINSPRSHPIVIECRGLIVDKDLGIVSRAFDRFFNLGELPEVTKEFSFNPKTEIYAKMDGSLISVYYNNSKWNIATRGTAFAESANYSGRMFSDMVVEAFGCTSIKEFNNKMDVLHPYNRLYTHIFEFISPENRIVTPYDKPEMVLLGVRNIITGELITKVNKKYLEAAGLKVRLVEEFRFNELGMNRESLLSKISGLDEGFVCYDPVSKVRVKVKSDRYVAMHKLRGEGFTPSPNNIMSLVVEGETEEYLCYFPTDAKLFSRYIEGFELFLESLSNSYEKAKDIENQKEFAISIAKHSFKGLLFEARKTGLTPHDIFSKLSNANKVKYLKAYIEQHNQ